MKRIAFILALLIQPVLFAQNEGNIWYFGTFAGIDFNSGAPVALTNGALNAFEGSASISDPNGVLQFYTDGITVFNRNHQAMPNGTDLTGDFSSTQSATIVKKPGINSIYFIFTTDYTAQSNGLRYSEVDMSSQGGLGDINSNKNIPIVTPTCEKVTVIKHCNNIDFWVITHLFGSNTFQSYLLTATGLNTTPIISNVGTSISGIAYNATGHLKGSIDGSRIAIANNYMNNVELFDFNNATGLLSNPITFNNFINGAYGVEFSPDNNLLYVSERGSGNGNIYQYNLLAGSPTAIINSRTTIGSYLYYGGALQLAPDNKIYHARFNSGSLGVINNPNEIGISSTYVANGFYLSGKISNYGLPNLYSFNNSNNNNNPAPTVNLRNDTTLCQGETLLLEATTPNATYLWQDNSTNSTFNITQQGTYWVDVTIACETASDTINVNYPTPTVNFGNDTTLCQGLTLLLNATTPNATYLWQDNSTNSTFNITQQGTYWVEVTVNNCSTSDTIQVNYNPTPTANIGNDTIICQGETLLLDATTPNSTYLWQDNSTTPTLNITQQGIYWVQITGSCGTIADTTNVNYNPRPIVNIRNDTNICQGETLLLDATTPNATYLWQDNSTNSTFNITQQGTYWVEVTVNNCSTSDTIQVNYNPIPTVNIGNDTTTCQGETLLLDATTPNSTYLWQDNSTTPTFNITQQGIYWVQVTVSNCRTSDTIEINYNPSPTIELPNDTNICQGDTLTLDASTTNATYLWQDNSTTPTFNTTQQGTYWVEVTVKNCSTSDTIQVNYNPIPTVNIGNDTTICQGETLLLDATTPTATYLWQDNSTHPTFNVTQQGSYWIEVSLTNCGPISDTITISLEGCECTLYIPNSFTPNSDNKNDQFLPIFDCDITEYSFLIFNRWGEIIFETNILNHSWNGDFQGKTCPTGVYVCVVKYKNEGSYQKKYGQVALLK
jgi:gliding motility-associated-like protein